MSLHQVKTFMIYSLFFPLLPTSLSTTMNGIMANTLLRHVAATPNATNDVPYQTTYLITGANRGLPRLSTPTFSSNPSQASAKASPPSSSSAPTQP